MSPFAAIVTPVKPPSETIDAVTFADVAVAPSTVSLEKALPAVPPVIPSTTGVE